jgi:phosphohistidine phosphatase
MPVNLYVIRHAHALPVHPPEIATDEDRPLSETGRAQVAALAAALRCAGVSIELLLSSPWKRALETAEDLGRHLGIAPAHLETTVHLQGGGSPKKLAKALRGIAADSVAIVGHEPDLGQFLAWLVGSKRAQIELAKASVAHVICDEPPRKGAGRLQWLVTPAWFEGEKRDQARS